MLEMKSLATAMMKLKYVVEASEASRLSSGQIQRVKISNDHLLNNALIR